MDARFALHLVLHHDGSDGESRASFSRASVTENRQSMVACSALLGAHFWDAPLLLKPWLEVVFLTRGGRCCRVSINQGVKAGCKLARLPRYCWSTYDA